jgi:hypothetical protein
MMKKTFIPAIASALLMLFASCQKTAVNKEKGDGFLTFEDFSLDLDETVITKAAVAADGTYRISIIDADGVEIINKPYSEVKNNDNKISLPAGAYTLVASSQVEVPESAFERPVYGTSKAFAITAGEVTNIGQLVCQLLQCKVTVDYNDEFLAAVTGPGTTTVTLKAGYPLEYALNADKTYNKNAGYFEVEGNTMEVVFSGSINGKLQKMRKTFTGIEARQWRQIKFIQKKNEQGQATFDIVINDLISDVTLNNNMSPKEDILSDYDPQAPKGDGGITLLPYYEGGCDTDITDLNNLIIKNPETDPMVIKFMATVPDGVKVFKVAIETNNPEFKNAVDVAEAADLDLINPTAKNQVIFQAVPFPHGEELLGKTEVLFDLSAAQGAIYDYPGVHSFTMSIIDNNGAKNTIPVTMLVNR